MNTGRKSSRLRNFDYTQAGAYFVTICSYRRMKIFGCIQEGIYIPSDIGSIVQEEWRSSESIRDEIELDTWVLMPNHLHGIVWILPSQKPVGAHGRAPLHRKPRSLGAFIAGFKSASTKRENQLRLTPRYPIWQRNYYDHIIRDDRDLEDHRRYILENPARWEMDRYFCKELCPGHTPSHVEAGFPHAQ